METKNVSLRIIGKTEEKEKLTPETLDIIEVQNFLEIGNKLISGDLEKDSRGTVGLNYEEGSVIFNFVVSAALATGFNADLAEINRNHTLEGVAKNRAISIVELQRKAKKMNWEFEISGSDPKKEETKIRIGKDTAYAMPADEWVEVEKVLYGELTDIGGSSTSNMHVKLEDGKTIKIPASKEETIDVNDHVKIYNSIGVLVSAKENRKTKELDKDSITFIELVPLEGDIKAQLDKSMEIGSKVWKDVPDAADFIRKKRNNYD